jgi:Spy/CpxP family protein refolding chaperone
MERMIKRSWQVRLAVVVIFLLGFAAGALTLNLYHSNRSVAWSEGRRNRFERMISRLDLNEDQKARVEKILSDARIQFREVRKETQPRFDEVRAQVQERLKEVLTPEQWQKFQQMIEERHNQHRRRGRY